MWIIALSTPLILLLLLTELILDRLVYKKYYRFNDFFANLNCGLGHSVMNQFAHWAGIGLYELVYTHFKLVELPNTLLTGVVLFIAIDFLYYWAHRSSHEVNLLWTDHAVHHMGEDLNLAAALRLGYYQIFYAFLFYVPLAVLGFEPRLFIILLTLSTLYQFWIHTEVVRKLGFIEKILITPSHHRVHHGRNPQYIDKNYGGVFILWDKLFGTYQPEEEPVIYGITHPVNSFNPINFQMHQLKILVRTLRATPGLGNKMKVLFKKPGWLPARIGEAPLPQPAPTTGYQKYDVALPGRLNTYLLVHCLLLLVGAGAFLAHAPSLSLPVKLLGAGLVFFNIFSIGVLFDGRSWAIYTEPARFAALLVALYFLPVSTDKTWYYLALSAIALPSAYLCQKWLRQVYGGQDKQQDKNTVRTAA
jgi:sterol desaturase/sphingolipid hydroxylase (fatty acid hydroxylase superfamily)